MLRDRVSELYLNQDYNCAETILLAANQEYGLDLAPEDVKLVGGFGGGLGCQNVCGALCGGIAALGAKKITGRAHTSEGFRDICAAHVADFVEKLGSDNCGVLIKKYKRDDTRCLETVLLAADVLEESMKK